MNKDVKAPILWQWMPAATPKLRLEIQCAKASEDHTIFSFPVFFLIPMLNSVLFLITAVLVVMFLLLSQSVCFHIFQFLLQSLVLAEPVQRLPTMSLLKHNFSQTRTLGPSLFPFPLEYFQTTHSQGISPLAKPCFIS